VPPLAAHLHRQRRRHHNGDGLELLLVRGDGVERTLQDLGAFPCIARAHRDLQRVRARRA
jgi:hypothetical protein